MGAHESKQSGVAYSDQHVPLHSGRPSFKIRRKNGTKKRNSEQEGEGDSPRSGRLVIPSVHRPVPVTHHSLDEPSVSTTTNTECSEFSMDPEYHSIELCTLSSFDGLLVNPKLPPPQDFSSVSSAFQTYRPPGRRRRAYAVDESCPGRRKVTRVRTSQVTPLPSQPSCYASSPHLFARRMWLLGEADRYENEGNLLVARPYLEECIRMDESVLVNPLAAAYVYHKLGNLTWKIGAYHDSIRVLSKCLGVYGAYADQHVPTSDEMQALVVVLTALGRAHISLGELDPAIQYIRESIAILKHAISTHDKADNILQSLLAQSLVCMGTVYQARGRSNRAMKTYEKCLLIQRTCRIGCHGDVATTLNRIGSVHETRGAYDEAMVCYIEALGIYRSQLGRGCSPLDVAVTLNHTGFIYFIWKEYDTALAAYREALTIFSLLLGPCHRNITSTKFHIAQAYIAKRLTTQGLKLLKEVLRAQNVSVGNDHPDVAIVLEALATANENRGKLCKACSYHKKALDIRIRRYGSSHVLVARTNERLGQLHRECGRIDDARHCFRKALIIYRSSDQSEDNDLRIRSLEKCLAQVDRMEGRERAISKRRLWRAKQRRGRTRGLRRYEEEVVLFDISENDHPRYVL